MTVTIDILNCRDVHACEAFAASWRTDKEGALAPAPGITPSDFALLVADLAALARGLAANRAEIEGDLVIAQQRLASTNSERDAARAKVETLRARLAERPAPPDPRDPPVSTAAEEAIERLWTTLLNKASIERDDFATAASGDPAGELLDLADAVESVLDKANEQIRELTEERDHATHLAMEQFRHRLYRT